MIEEGADVCSLRGHLGSGSADDLFLQAEPGGDVEPSRGTRNAESQLIGWSEGLLIEADGGVEYAGMVGRVDLERGKVGGNTAPGVQCEEVGGDGDGESC